MKYRFAEGFRDLVVYQKSRAVSLDIFRLTKGFPRDEIYSMTDQVRRSSRSIGAQIAEAWAKRRYEKHFVSKLSDADGEQNETQHWIESARDCGYLSPSDASRLIQELHAIGGMLNGMIQKAYLFCQPRDKSVHEECAEYIVLQEVSGCEH